MSEVSMIPGGNSQSIPAASSKGNVKAVVDAGGQSLPPATADLSREAAQDLVAPQVKVGVEQAVSSINDYVQSLHRDLQFTVDEELDRTVVKVVDSVSGELIRQIPEEAFLELARRLSDDGDMRLIDALG